MPQKDQLSAPLGQLTHNIKSLPNEELQHSLLQAFIALSKQPNMNFPCPAAPSNADLLKEISALKNRIMELENKLKKRDALPTARKKFMQERDELILEAKSFKEKLTNIKNFCNQHIQTLTSEHSAWQSMILEGYDNSAYLNRYYADGSIYLSYYPENGERLVTAYKKNPIIEKGPYTQPNNHINFQTRFVYYDTNFPILKAHPRIEAWQRLIEKIDKAITKVLAGLEAYNVKFNTIPKPPQYAERPYLIEFNSRINAINLALKGAIEQTAQDLQSIECDISHIKKEDDDFDKSIIRVIHFYTAATDSYQCNKKNGSPIRPGTNLRFTLSHRILKMRGDSSVYVTDAIPIEGQHSGKAYQYNANPYNEEHPNWQIGIPYPGCISQFGCQNYGEVKGSPDFRFHESDKAKNNVKTNAEDAWNKAPSSAKLTLTSFQGKWRKICAERKRIKEIENEKKLKELRLEQQRAQTERMKQYDI